MSTLERKRVKVLKTAQIKNIFKNKPFLSTWEAKNSDYLSVAIIILR